MYGKYRGVLLFAFNTATVDYVEIAVRAARLIKHTTNFPVSLVTDVKITNDIFDEVIVIENDLVNVRQGYAGSTQWRNGARCRAFELTPYDETILVDTDYLMLDKSLVALLDSTDDYRLMYHNKFLTNASNENMGPFALPYVWATVIIFKRTNKTGALFNMVQRIQNNYQYYRKLYNIVGTNFRNDYAFAIANYVVNGYAIDPTQSIPWPMLTAENLIENIDVNPTNIVIREKDKAFVLPRQNVHVIDKDYLLSDRFSTFIESICHD